jgi:hypothetical protein
MTDNTKNMDALLDEARGLGKEYLAKWRACAPSTFAAIMDTLGYKGDAVAEGILKAVIGLTGGTGFMAVGTCGAMAGAAAAVSYGFNLGRDDLDGDVMKMIAVNNAVAKIGRKVEEAYGHITCQEIQFRHWGKSFRFTHPEAFMEFASFSAKEKSGFKCRELVGEVSRWTVEHILRENPAFCKR